MKLKEWHTKRFYLYKLATPAQYLYSKKVLKRQTQTKKTKKNTFLDWRGENYTKGNQFDLDYKHNFNTNVRVDMQQSWTSYG